MVRHPFGSSGHPSGERPQVGRGRLRVTHKIEGRSCAVTVVHLVSGTKGGLGESQHLGTRFLSKCGDIEPHRTMCRHLLTL